MTIMSEMPAGDTHDVIRRAGAVMAVVVPIAEYQRLRQAAEEQRINEEFDAGDERVVATRYRSSRMATTRTSGESYRHHTAGICRHL